MLELGEDENFSILQWWKRNSELYPTLAKMARDFLAVPVSLHLNQHLVQQVD